MPYARTEQSGKVKQSEFSMRGRVLTGSVAALLLLGGIGGWATTAKLSGAVISSGTVLVEDSVKVLQHPDGGVIRAIAVRKGDNVTKGQVLLRLEDVQIRTEQTIIMGQLSEYIARRSRLEAERDGAATIAFPEDFLENYPSAGPIIQGEQRLFDSMTRNRKSRRDQLELQVDQLHEEVSGLEFQAAAILQELTLVREEQDRMHSLAAKGLIETTRINSGDRELARMMGSQGEVAASIARSNARISEIQVQILAIDDLAYTDAQQELRQLDAAIAEQENRLTEVTDRLARTEIRAPVSGVINELAVTTLGGVITPAERLMTIVPQDADLKIEFRVQINDIDQIDVGQPAKLRFSAFDQRTTPEIDAVISRVSAAATSDGETGHSFYLAEAEVTGDLSVLGPRGLIPGMPVEVFVQTREQLVISYFVKPFTDQIARAFREE